MSMQAATKDSLCRYAMVSIAQVAFGMAFPRKASMALVAVSMMAAPVTATASDNYFAGLVADTMMTDALAQGEEDGAGFGGASSYIIPFFVVVAVGLGIYAATSNDDKPTSP